MFMRTSLLVVVDESVERALLLLADVRHQQADRVPIGRRPLYAAEIIADDLGEVEAADVTPSGARPHDPIRRARSGEHDHRGRLPAVQRQILWHALDWRAVSIMLEKAQAARESFLRRLARTLVGDGGRERRGGRVDGLIAMRRIEQRGLLGRQVD